MLFKRLTSVLSFILLILSPAITLANQNILNIFVENKSNHSFTLVIYGSGSAYEIRNGFNKLAPQKNSSIQINYAAVDDKQIASKPTDHILLLNSDSACCKVEYSSHPSHASQYHLFKRKKFTAKLKSYTGPCKVWSDSTDHLHIVLLDEDQLTESSPTASLQTKAN